MDNYAKLNSITFSLCTNNCLSIWLQTFSKKYRLENIFLLQYRIRPDLDPNAVFDIGLTCYKKMFLK